MLFIVLPGEGLCALDFKFAPVCFQRKVRIPVKPARSATYVQIRKGDSGADAWAGQPLATPPRICIRVCVFFVRGINMLGAPFF